MIQMPPRVTQVDQVIRSRLAQHESGLTLEYRDKCYLLGVCRATLESCLSGRSIEPDDFSDVPDNIRGQRARTFVTLYTGDRVRGCQSASTGDLLDSAILATKRAMRDRRFGVPVGERDLPRTRIDVEIILKGEPLNGRHIKDLEKSIALGVDALSLSKDNKAAFYKSNVPISHRLDTEKTLKRLSRKAGLEPLAYQSLETTLTKHKTIHFFEDFTHRFSDPSIVEAYRNRPVVLQSHVDRYTLEHSLRLCGEYMVNHVSADGRTSYLYDPKRNKRTFADDSPVSVLRKLASIWALAQVGTFFSNQHYLDTAKRAAAYAIERYYLQQPGEDFGYIKVGRHAHIGLAAFALLILNVINDEEFYPQVRRFLANFIVSMHDKTQGFLYPSYLPTRYSDAERNQIYYPGEALTAIVNEAEKRSDNRLIALAENVFPYYQSLFERSPKRMSMAAWLSKAYSKSFLLTGRRVFADFVLAMNDVVVGNQRGIGERYFDRIGSWTSTGKSAATGVFLESVSDGLAIARAVGDAERIRTYSDSLLLGMRYILQCQYDQRDVFADDARRLTVGGFPMSLYDRTIRIDNVQHCASALIGALNHLDLKFSVPDRRANGWNGDVSATRFSRRPELSFVPKVRKGYLLRRQDDGLWICTADGEKLFACNDNAGMIWELCNGQRAIRDIAALLAAAYSTDLDRLTRDTRDIIQQLMWQGLLEAPVD